MPQHAEAFPQEDFQPEPKKEPEKKSAVILPFRRKENIEGETEQSYDKYKNADGILSPEEYQDILKRAADGTSFNSNLSVYAHSMAKEAGITLSPETATIYGIMSNERPNLAKERGEMSDRKLLAEALRIVGDENSRSAFIKNYPNIFN